ERQARRYVQLARSRDRLDRLNPTWMSELSLGEALDLVSEPRVAAVDRMESDPRWTAPPRRGTAGDSAMPTEKAGDDEITPETLSARQQVACPARWFRPSPACLKLVHPPLHLDRVAVGDPQRHALEPSHRQNEHSSAAIMPVGPLDSVRISSAIGRSAVVHSD